MQLAAKIRKDFLKVDRFWRTFLTNHSKYNPMPFDQLAPIESPAPFRVENNSHYKNNQIVPVSQNDVGVQTLEISNLNEKSNPTTNGFPFHGINGTISDLPIEEVKIESHDSVKSECEDDNIDYADSNDYPIDSDGDGMDDEDSKDMIGEKQANFNDTRMKRRSGRKYPKNRNIHGADPIKGEEKLFKCLDHECKQGKLWKFVLLFEFEMGGFRNFRHEYKAIYSVAEDRVIFVL